MIRSLAVLAALGLATLPCAARAQADVSGAMLARACNGRSPADLNSCDGYIAGVNDTVRDSPELRGKLCPPDHVKLSLLREGLARFAQLRPDDAKGPGFALVAAFIKATYPCPGH